MSSPFLAALAHADQIQLETFGEEITYFPEAGGEIDLQAIEQQPGQNEDRAPGIVAKYWIRLSDFGDTVPKRRVDAVVVRNEEFEVDDVQADGAGGVVILLRRR